MGDYLCYRCQDSGCGACEPILNPEGIHKRCGFKWKEHPPTRHTDKQLSEALRQGYAPPIRPCP